MGELYVQGRLEQLFEKKQGLGIGGLANGMPFIVGSQVKNTFVYRDLDIHMYMYVYIFAPIYFCIIVCSYIKVDMNSYTDFGRYYSGFSRLSGNSMQQRREIWLHPSVCLIVHFH